MHSIFRAALAAGVATGAITAAAFWSVGHPWTLRLDNAAVVFPMTLEAYRRWMAGEVPAWSNGGEDKGGNGIAGPVGRRFLILPDARLKGRSMRRMSNQRMAATRGLGAALLLTAATLAGCGKDTSGPPAAPPQAPAAKVSQAPTVQANPASVEGHLDLVNGDVIAGWGMDTTQPASPVTVELYDGDALLASVPAREFRQDLLAAGKGDGYHAFKIPTPARLKDGQTHTVRAKCAGVELRNSPQTIPKG